MSHAEHTLIPENFRIAPSADSDIRVSGADALPEGLDAYGYAVAATGPVSEELGFDRETLARLGFTGESGQTLLLPDAGGRLRVAVGTGEPDTLSIDSVRDAAAAFARAAAKSGRIGTDLVAAALAGSPSLDRDAVVGAVVEGAVLARYRYDELKSKPGTVPLSELLLAGAQGVEPAIERAVTLSQATMLARDLASAPPAHLTATQFADFAADLGPRHGLEVEVFDKRRLIELGCGGLLGVNAGSVEEPRMIQLRYRPESPRAHLALVGKGIMYDSGGIALKPGDAMHATMKTDMSGAGAVLAAMLALGELRCENAVTGYLMCTDNMPSGSAMALGEVLRIHGGTTVEVKNTDAEGRLVMSDAIVLAREEGVDAIVDIATLTGAALRALGTLTAPLFGNSDALIAQVRAASEATDEDVWELPLERRYRSELNSDIADISNLGGPNAGATTAALFLAEFAGDTPWAHVDMAGTNISEKDDSWRPKGPTGFGARLLAEFALAFEPVR